MPCSEGEGSVPLLVAVGCGYGTWGSVPYQWGALMQVFFMQISAVGAVDA